MTFNSPVYTHGCYSINIHRSYFQNKKTINFHFTDSPTHYQTLTLQLVHNTLIAVRHLIITLRPYRATDNVNLCVSHQHWDETVVSSIKYIYRFKICCNIFVQPLSVRIAAASNLLKGHVHLRPTEPYTKYEPIAKSTSDTMSVANFKCYIFWRSVCMDDPIINVILSWMQNFRLKHVCVWGRQYTAVRNPLIKIVLYF